MHPAALLSWGLYFFDISDVKRLREAVVDDLQKLINVLHALKDGKRLIPLQNLSAS